MRLSHAARVERREAMARCAATKGVHVAAAEFKVTAQTVSVACKEFKVKPLRVQSDKIKPPKTAFVMLKRLLDGKSQVEIADELKVTRQRVNQIAQAALAAGIVLPEKGEVANDE